MSDYFFFDKVKESGALIDRIFSEDRLSLGEDEVRVLRMLMNLMTAHFRLSCTASAMAIDDVNYSVCEAKERAQHQTSNQDIIFP